ncbi:MAG: cytochrome o ubiquinol oxidase subunit III, partial [Pedobacter sp.]
LVSSFTFGMAMLAQHKQKKSQVLGWLAFTFVLGAGFIGMEVYEFNHLIHVGHGPTVSAFLSAYFSLVGTHGLHVTAGLIWMVVLAYQISTTGLTTPNIRRLACLSIFWHFLDIVWICVFSVVYLLGAIG